MKLSCQVEKEEGLAILRLGDERLEYPKTVVLKSYIIRLLGEGYNKLVLDLEKVKSLDSFGLAVIISVMKDCKNQQGALYLFGLNDFNLKLIEMTKLSKVLHIFPNEQAAREQLKAHAVVAL